MPRAASGEVTRATSSASVGRSDALLADRRFAYRSQAHNPCHRSLVCYVFLCVLPRGFLSKRETGRSLRESIKYFAHFSFLPDLHAQFRRDTRKPRTFRVRLEETHFAAHSFISLTYLLTWSFVINSQSHSRICCLRICLTVTPEWAVHSRPRYQDSVQVNRILFAQL